MSNDDKIKREVDEYERAINQETTNMIIEREICAITLQKIPAPRSDNAIWIQTQKL
jgi:hypothetical protein